MAKGTVEYTEAERELDAAREQAKRNKENRGSSGLGQYIGKDAREKRRDRRRIRDAKKAIERDDNMSLGSSKEEERRYLDEARDQRLDTGAKSEETRGRLTIDAGRQEGRARGLDSQYFDARQTTNAGLGTLQGSVDRLTGTGKQAGNLLQGAYNANQLTGTTENVLGQRNSAMGAQPSLGALTNQALAAQQNQMQAQTNFAQGQLARQAMGVAAGQGEGGALAAQQALAGLTQAGGDMAVQNNLAFGQQAADMRGAAAMGMRQEAVDSANLGLQARLNAAAQERQNQLAVAGQRADLMYGSARDTVAGQTAYQSAAQSAQNTAGAMATSGNTAAQNSLGTLAQFDTTREGIANEKELGFVTAEAQLGQTAEQTPKDRPAWAKGIDPFNLGLGR